MVPYYRVIRSISVFLVFRLTASGPWQRFISTNNVVIKFFDLVLRSIYYFLSQLFYLNNGRMVFATRQKFSIKFYMDQWKFHHYCMIIKFVTSGTQKLIYKTNLIYKFRPLYIWFYNQKIFKTHHLKTERVKKRNIIRY